MATPRPQPSDQLTVALRLFVRRLRVAVDQLDQAVGGAPVGRRRQPAAPGKRKRLSDDQLAQMRRVILAYMDAEERDPPAGGD